MDSYDHPPKGVVHKTILAVLLTVSLLLMFILVAYPFFIVESPDPVVRLNGTWKIAFQDSPEFAAPDYDDSGWSQIVLPGNIMTSVPEGDYSFKGVCWVRKQFTSEDFPEESGLIAGRIGGADQTFINGHPVGETGSFPPEDFSMWNFTRSYPIRNGLLRPNSDNLIAIRIHYNQTGEITGQITLAERTASINYGKSINFILINIGQIVIAVGASYFLLFSLFYLKNQEEEEYLFYCLQLITGLPIVLETCIGWNIFPSAEFRHKLLGISWTAVNVAHPIFLHRIYNLRRPLVEKGLVAYLFLILILCVFFTDESQIRQNGLLLNIVTWFIGFYHISCHITALVQRRPYAKIFSFFGVAVVLLSMHDGFIYMTKYSSFTPRVHDSAFSIMTLQVGALILYIGTALVLVFRYFENVEEINKLNESLEHYIIENRDLSEKLISSSVEKKPEKAELSPKVEQRIKDVIDFIHDKYLENIDRQIIADAIGLHPDHLSKQFKKYTGKKIGDYIYELRITEAAKRLRETDANIIDIAFDVGFESLRTFNRIFPRIMNITPDKYRKMHSETD